MKKRRTKKTKTKRQRRRGGIIRSIMAMAEERALELLKVGELYRPVKKPVTIRLDADVIEWLKRDGRGYQTKANAILRREMMRSLGEGKKK